MKKLTGAGNPFHSALDKAAGMLKRKVGTGAEFMQELNGIPGVKKEEILDRKLHDIMGMPKMTHEQFLGELGKRPVPQIEEKNLGGKEFEKKVRERAERLAYNDARDFLRGEGLYGEDLHDAADEMADENVSYFIGEAESDLILSGKTPTPFHSDYTIPGGENYREMLIKAPPGGEQFPGVGGHFGGEPSILASMRLKDRTGPNGEKLLHLEELQSDWHQQGREKGYKGDTSTEGWSVKSPNPYEPDEVIVYDQNGKAVWTGTNRFGTDRQIIDKVSSQLNLKKVPDAPFKKNWEEMALKRLIHHAAENGYHGIVVTPSAEQASRYDLSKQIDSIEFNKMPDGNIFWTAYKDGKRAVGNDSTPSELESQVGKELAKKIIEHEGPGKLSGIDLQVGGEGMKGFYDKKVPNILNSIGKKYGVKTELHGHKLVTEEASSRPTYNFLGQVSGKIDYPEKSKQLHHFPITEEMRQDVLKNGLPLYKEGGEVDAEEVFMGKGGKVKELEQYLRDREGEYGVKRLQRAADEIPGLENMYTLQALKEAFGGDNAKALMTMNPAEFERFAEELGRFADEDATKYTKTGERLPFNQYLDHLAKITGGFSDVPYLEINKRKPEYLPNISGHEGRHRSRALTNKGVQKSLVRLLPSPSIRESMPRNYREDFIEAMKKKLGERYVVPETEHNKAVQLATFGNNKQAAKQIYLSSEGKPQLPEIYKDGGDVDAESVFFPKFKE